MNSKNAMLQAALSYTAQGYKVLPLKPRGKIPLTTHGLKDAAQLQATIKEYWQNYPNANIGIVCDGLLVLDFDGKAGAESKGQLEAKFEKLPRTWTIKTGGGTKAEPKEQGEHYVYKVPTDLNIRPGAGKYGYAGLDIRANDSYIVAAPSVTRLPYETIDNSPVADAPSWLIELAKQKQVPISQVSIPAGQPIPEGQRNHALTSLAGTMRRRGMTQTEIEAALLATNQDRCQPPLDSSEVSRIAASVCNYNPTAVPAPKKQTAHPDNNKPTPLTLKLLSDVTSEVVKWLWHPYIPFGKLTLLEGDPGVGKSWLALAIATGVSLGHGLPNQSELACGPVLLASAEDGLSDTIKPRLTAMQANTGIISAIEDLFTLDEAGFEQLEEKIIEVTPVLVIIDPLVAYLSGNMDINKANQVRFATARLHHLAEKYGPAIIAIRHLTKGGSLKPIYRGLGSIDFTAAARSVLLAGQDPDLPNIRGFAHIKHNLSPKGEPIGYEITEQGFFWLDHSDLTEDRILEVSTDGSKGQDAEDFLKEQLSGGPVLSEALIREAKERLEISEATLNRAKRKIKVTAYRQGELGKKGGGKWYWKLPEVG